MGIDFHQINKDRTIDLNISGISGETRNWRYNLSRLAETSTAGRGGYRMFTSDISDNLIVNSIEYPDKFFNETEFFNHFFDAKSTTFKLINTIIETDSLSPISTKEFEKTN